MTAKKQPSLMRNLGAFFGHIVEGIKTDPSKPPSEKHEIRREVEEHEETAPDGRKVTVRRTTIEEVEIHEARPRDAAGGQTS